MSPAKRRYWLAKTEPTSFSWDDLWSAKGRRTCWDGVRNYQARNFIRDEIKKGDLVLLYHSNAKPAGAVGIAEVVKESYVDHTQFDPQDHHFDPKSKPENPSWLMFDIKARNKLPEFVGLPALKENPRLGEMLVVQRGQRLSIQPVTPAEWKEVLKMGGLSGADVAKLS